MKSARRNLTVLGIVSGAVLLAVAAIWVSAPRKTISIEFVGLRDTPWPDGQRPLFVITNPLPYRVTWTMLAPEFELASGWTTTQAPKVTEGGRVHELRFGGETLLPGASFEIYGIAPTNVPYRYPVLWGMHPADALLRPKWKRMADEWCERVGVGALFLPHGIRRTVSIAAKSPSQAGAANRSQAVGFETNRASGVAHSK